MPIAEGTGNTGEPSTKLRDNVDINQPRTLHDGAGSTLANCPRKNIYVAIISDIGIKMVTIRQAVLRTRGEEAFQAVIEHWEEGFIRAKVKGLQMYSCYASPSASLNEYKQMLSALVVDTRGRWAIIIAGDFNPWALEQGSQTTNMREHVLLFAELDAQLANVGTSKIFRGKGLASIIRKAAWKVIEDYTHSDHQAIYDKWRSRANRTRKRAPTLPLPGGLPN